MTQKNKAPKDLAQLVRPYTFVLQEGGSIQEDFLDYSLKLLIGRPEVIRTNFSESIHLKQKISRR